MLFSLAAQQRKISLKRKITPKLSIFCTGLVWWFFLHSQLEKFFSSEGCSEVAARAFSGGREKPGIKSAPLSKNPSSSHLHQHHRPAEMADEGTQGQFSTLEGFLLCKSLCTSDAFCFGPVCTGKRSRSRYPKKRTPVSENFNWFSETYYPWSVVVACVRARHE